MWNIFTPHLTSVVILFASPVTLVVALWGMTGERALQLMRNHALENTHLLVDINRQ
jgi:hypothetical protein